MFYTHFCLLMLTATVLAEEMPFKLFGAPNRAPYNVHDRARARWPFHSQDDPYRQPTEGISHDRTTESHSEYPNYSATTVTEYWRPSAVNLTMTNSNAYTHSRPYAHTPLTSGNSPYLKDVRGSLYYQSRPAKKNHPHYVYNKVQMYNSDSSKYKKTVIYPSASLPLTYKKPLHPRVHKPYAKHKYPTQKTVHPLYRRYYQSQYQRYSIPASEMLRQKVAQSDYSHYPSSSTAPSDGHHTTERMDDVYPDASAPSEDFALHNSTGSYYDAYEEPDRPPSEESPAYDETTTRGYYGDRIYMSTHLPLTAPDKPATKNSYYIIKRTSDDDDIETIFE